MTAGTAPLIDRQRDAIEAAADAATVTRLERDLIAVQKERIAEQTAEVESLLDQIKQIASDNHALEAENAALRAVAVAVERFCRLYILDDSRLEDALDDLIAAGYLPAEEVQP